MTTEADQDLATMTRLHEELRQEMLSERRAKEAAELTLRAVRGYLESRLADSSYALKGPTAQRARDLLEARLSGEPEPSATFRGVPGATVPAVLSAPGPSAVAPTMMGQADRAIWAAAYAAKFALSYHVMESIEAADNAVLQLQDVCKESERPHGRQQPPSWRQWKRRS